jgi:hypothetical protein
VNDNVNAKTKHVLPLLNTTNATIDRYINHHLQHIWFAFKNLDSRLPNFQIIPKLMHNSTTTAIRVVERHGYVHERHVVAVFIRKLIRSHVTQCEFSPLFVCLLYTYDTLNDTISSLNCVASSDRTAVSNARIWTKVGVLTRQGFHFSANNKRSTYFRGSLVEQT